MTIPVSTVPAAKSWLLAQLQAAVTIAADNATFEVTYGDEQDSPNNPADMVWLGDVQRTATPWTMTGGLTLAQSMQENYDLTVRINAYRPGDFPDVVEARAWALVAAVEDVVRTDPSFGGLLISSFPNQATAAVTWDDEYKGRLCDVTLTISCLAAL